MLSSTIAYLRRAIAAHPDFNPKDIYGAYTIETCSIPTLKMLALKLNIKYFDGDKRGRPRKDPIEPKEPTPVTYNPPLPITPAPTHSPANGGALEAIIKGIVIEVMQSNPATLDESQIIDLIAKHKGTVIERPLNITLPNMDTVTIPEGETHFRFPLILTALMLKLNVYLVGPAGSGKTSIGKQLADTMKLPFYGYGAVESRYLLQGFIDAHGVCSCPIFRKAYTEGGVIILDELDAWAASALLALNAALSNGWMDFPDGMKARHPDFYCVAGANTTGSGANRVYVGRNQLDAASLDRFVMIDLPYDPHLEAKMVGGDCIEPRKAYDIKPRETTNAHANTILNVIKAVRSAIDTHSIKHVVSPRASVAACKLYTAGWPVSEILDACIWKGIDKQSKTMVMNNAGVALALSSFA